MTVLRYHKALNGNLKIKVNSGSIKVTVLNIQNNQNLMQEFTQDNNYHYIEYDFIDERNNMGADSWEPIHVKIENVDQGGSAAVYFVYL